MAEKGLFNYEVPEILESAVYILSQYFSDLKTRLFSNKPWTYTRCKEIVPNIPSCQTAIGGLAVDGLTVCPPVFCIDHKSIGIAVMRKC